MAFFFRSDTNQNQCNRLKLEQCFETAFQTMRIRRNIDKNQNQSFGTFNIRNQRSLASVKHVLMSRNQHLCAANRHYLSCFNNDECQDDYTAHIASIIFNQIHGRFLPIQMFLAHKGYAIRLCSQTCSHESRMKCQQMLNIEGRQEEHGSYLKLLVQYRKQFCGEVAKCVCVDTNVQAVSTIPLYQLLYRDHLPVNTYTVT
ncbi:hypothetical protein DINM_005939 [Dirofilaria immitis]|nr:hypothetical protein [Dirofilaria immitis]